MGLMSRQAKVEVTDELLYEYEYVRQSGHTNMFDYKTVCELAKEFGLARLIFVAEYPQTYSQLQQGYRDVDPVQYAAWKVKVGLV
jgi:hypothetical protein